MITIKQDVEFMTNLLPAIPVLAENHFVAFKDKDSYPAVFSLGLNNKLNLIITEDGVPTLTDFGETVGLNGSVQAFDAQQGQDLKLNIAIATDAGGGQSEICLIHGVDPEDLTDGDFKPNIIRASSRFPYVNRIFMSDFTRTVAGEAFPLIFLAFQPADKITNEQQLGFVKFSVTGNTTELTLDTTWKLATNPQRIIAVSFGTCRVGQGAFVLYQSAIGVKLQFRTFYGNAFTVEPVCPTGATCLTSYVDPTTKHSVLLVGGDTITKFTAQEFVSSTAVGTTIVTSSADRDFLGVKGIHASVARGNVTVWYTTTDNSAYYFAAQSDSMENGILVPLLPKGKGGRLSGLLAASPTSSNSTSSDILIHMILSVDSAGNLTLMQQASDTRIWRTRPFYAVSHTQNMELSGYTLRIQAVSDDTTERHELAGCQLHLVSSGYLRAVVNGRLETLSREGDWYQADMSGALCILSEATDIASTSIHVVGFRPSSGSADQIINAPGLDPTAKITQKLSGIKCGSDLLNAKTQTGKPLVDLHTVDSKDAEKVAASIVTLLAYFQHKTYAQSLASKAGARALQKFFLDGIVESIWDVFEYVEEKATELAEWVVHKADDGLALIVTLAGETYRFVINSLETAKKAISLVLASVGVGIKKLIDFAGFIFSWSDILQTADSFVAYFDAGLGFGEDRLASLNENVQEWIADLRTTCKRALGQIPDVDLDAVSRMETSPDGVVAQDIRYGVPFNWSSYQLSHGGYSRRKTSSPGTMSRTNNGLFADLWTHVINEWHIISHLIEKLCQDITALFDSNELDTTTIVAKISEDIIDAALDSIANLTDALFKALIHIIGLIRKLGNLTIEIPVFSALWAVIADGRPFTVFNMCSLIVAIPCTVIYKTIAGIAPPALKGRLTSATFAQYLDHEDLTDPNLAADMQQFSSAGTIVVEYISLELLLISMAQDHTQLLILKKRFVTSSPGVLDGLKDKFDGVTLFDVFDVILDFPSPEKSGDGWQGIRWLLWGLDMSSKAVDAVKKYGPWKHKEELLKEASAGCQAVISLPVLLGNIVIHSMEYTDGLYGISFMEMMVNIQTDFFKFGGTIGFATEVFIQDPRVRFVATIVMYGCKVGRVLWKLMLWAYYQRVPKNLPPKKDSERRLT